jgi:hypothetical protein
MRIYYSFFVYEIARIYFLNTLSIPFYDFPTSPILVGALGIEVARAFFCLLPKRFRFSFEKELPEKKKALMKEQKKLN